LPEWYVYGYLYKRHGYLSAKGVKHLIYVPNYFVENHLHKYDMLYISYKNKIEPYNTDHGSIWYKGYDDAVSSRLIVDFAKAAGKYSGYDVSDILKEIERKRAWYYKKNPEEHPKATTETDLPVPAPDAPAVRETNLAPDFGRRLSYRGKEYLLGGVGDRKAFFDGCFCVPVNYTTEQIKSACVRIYRDLARKDLTAKVQEYAVKMGMEPPGLKISGAKTALGSCSANGKLSFSWRLVTGDDEVIDYVVASTLAYIIKPNRSSEYWSVVESVLPDYKERQRKLRWLQERLKAEEWI